MISLEKAKALKSAGLVWEPKRYDLYQVHPEEPWSEVICIMRQDHADSAKKWVGDGHIVWLPLLDQLLAEIERRGWNADSVSFKDGGYGCDIYWLSATVHTKYATFTGESREDAVASALLYILPPIDKIQGGCGDGRRPKGGSTTSK